MSGYVRDVVIKKQWDGDKVTFVLKPIGTGEMLGVTQFLNDGKLNLPVSELPKFLEQMKPFTKKVDGLKTHDAAEVTLDELYEAAYFFPLLTDVAIEWISKGTPENP